jgi:hypothetical protein
MRILIAGLIGGLVMFMWGAVSHMMLPIGEMGMKVPTEQASAITTLGSSTHGTGVYMYPSQSMEDWQDPAKQKAFADAAKGQPYAFVIYQPGGNPVNVSMTAALAKQWGSDTLAAIIAAWVLALCAVGFVKRVVIAGSLGLFAWVAIAVPFWNWYMFPTDFTIGTLLEQVIGWLLSGAAIAWWLGRGERR